MKKKLLLIFSLILALAMLMTSFACGKKEKEPDVDPEPEDPIVSVTYEVVVNGGEGGGTINSGNPVTITPVIPEGKKFVEWQRENGTLFATTERYTFTPTSDITINAIFEDENALPVYCTLSVENGTGSVTSALKGTSVTVEATPKSGQVFQNWTVEGEVVSEVNPYTFALNVDTAIVANFTGFPRFDLTIVGGTGPSSVYEGAEATVEATIVLGKLFKGWKIGSSIVSTDMIYTFAPTANTTIEAVFEDGLVVDFETFAGSEIASQTVGTNKKAVEPEVDPTLDGTMFFGWYADEEFTTPYDFDAPVTDSKTIYACYSIFKIANGKLVGFADGLAEEYIPTHMEIPSKVGHYAITEILEDAQTNFKYEKIEEVTIPSTITKIGVAGFKGMNGLKKVNFPQEGEIEICAFAFQQVPISGILTIPGSVKSIGANAFEAGTIKTLLREVNFTGEVAPTISKWEGDADASSWSFVSNIFAGQEAIERVFVPVGKLAEFTSADYLGKYYLDETITNANNVLIPQEDRDAWVGLAEEYQEYTFDVEIIGGSGSGTYGEFEWAEIVAETKTGFRFVNWTIGSDVVSTEKTYEFEVTEDVTVTANYDAKIALNTPLGAVINVTNNGYDSLILDRCGAGNFVYVDGQANQIDYVKVYVYLSNAPDATPAGSFMWLRKNMLSTDGEYKMGLQGEDGNYYLVNYSVVSFLKRLFGEEYSATNKYYFAAQYMTTEDNETYTHSAIGPKSTKYFRETDKCIVEAIYGTGGGQKVIGDSITITANTYDGINFVGWYKGEELISDQASYTFVASQNITLVAKYDGVVPKEKLTKVTASAINPQGNGQYIIALERGGNLLFTGAQGSNIECAVVYIYETRDANQTPIGQFYWKSNLLYNADSTITNVLSGGPGNYYTNVATFTTFIRSIMGENYNPAQKMYFAVQLKAYSDSPYFADSDIGPISTRYFREIEFYNVNVLNGTGGGKITVDNQTTITANVYPGNAFVGWYLYKDGALSTEKWNENATVAFTPSSHMTIVAVYENPVEKAKLDAPVANMFYIENNGNYALAFERNGTSVFNGPQSEFLDYVMVHVYSDEDKTDEVGTFMWKKDRNFYSADGATNIGNGGGTWIGNSSVASVLALALGEDYSAEGKYYLAIQFIALDDAIFGDSDVGPVGKGFYFSALG